MRRFKGIFVSVLALFSVLLSGCSFFSSFRSYSINLKTTALNLAVGDDPVSIKYVVESNSIMQFDDTILWSSQNEEIASVNDEGFVSAVGEGATKIVASLKIKPSIQATCDVTVIDNTGLNVALNASKQKIQQGKSYRLIAKVTNYQETDEVVWSGSTEGITVENGLVKVDESAQIGTTALIKATSKENPEKYSTCKITVIKKENNIYDYTIMLYMSASTLEFEHTVSYGLFSEDIIEILSVKNIPSNVKIIIETGGTKRWAMPTTALIGDTSISSDHLQRWEVVSASPYVVSGPASNQRIICYNSLKLVENLENNFIAKESSFESFLKWGLKNYSANQMGVILSGHGGGVDGCCYDDNYNQASLTAGDIALASKNALNESEKDTFTFIGYDCCIMAGLDNASMNVDYFDYMVASQENEYGNGYDHDVYLEKLVEDPEISPTELLPLIGKSFVEENHNHDCPYYVGPDKYYCYQTASVVDLSELGSAVNLFNSFSENVTFEKVKSAFKSSKLNAFGDGCYGLVDINDFLSHYANENSGVNVDSIKSAINNAVIANYYCSQYKSAPCGLNLFVPISNVSSIKLQVVKSNYTGNQTKLATWQKMCLDYGTFYDDIGYHSGGNHWF